MHSAAAEQAIDRLFNAPYITSDPTPFEGDALNLRMGTKEYTAQVAVLAEPSNGSRDCYYGGAGVPAGYYVKVNILEISEEISGELKKGPRWNEVAKKIREALLDGRRFSESNVDRFLADYKAGIDSFMR